MSNPKSDYNTEVRANLPAGITFDSTTNRYVVNDKSWVSYYKAKWYLDYITKFGFEGASFNVTITGLTDGEARIGSHASIGYTETPTSATETVKWSNSSDPAAAATYGTGANPTDYTAGDEGLLWLHVTDGGETVSRSAPIRYAPGTPASIADGQSFTVDTAITAIDASATGGGLTWTYSATGLPASLSINTSTGSITGTVDAAGSGTVTVTATDQYSRTVQDTFTYTASLRTQATAANGLGPFNWTVDDTTVNVNAATDFTANGNTLTYAATGLPAGVTIASNGTISGTPTAASSGSIVITATDEYGRETTSTASHTTALRAQATGGTDLDLSFPEDSAISSTDLIANWTANGNTLTFVSVSPALPTGLSISSAGAMTGTPTDITADATYTLTMEDEYSRQTSDTFTLEITAVVSNLITNGSFDTDVSGWSTQNAVITWESGQGDVRRTGSNGSAYQAVATTIGVTYEVSGILYAANSQQIIKSDTTAPFGTNWTSVISTSPILAGTFQSNTFTATATTTYIHLANDGGGSAETGVNFDDVSMVAV